MGKEQTLYKSEAEAYRKGPLDYLMIFASIAAILVGSFAVLLVIIWGFLGFAAAQGLLNWIGAVTPWALGAFALTAGYLLITRENHRHSERIVAATAFALTRHDAVDAAGDAARIVASHGPPALGGTDTVRLIESQQALQKAFLTEVASTARALADARPAAPQIEMTPGRPMIGAAGDEW